MNAPRVSTLLVIPSKGSRTGSVYRKLERPNFLEEQQHNIEKCDVSRDMHI